MQMDDPGTDLERTLDLAEEALDRGDPDTARELCQHILETEPEHPGALFLLGEAHRDLRELNESEELYRLVLRATPTHSPTWSALGAVLFDQLRFEEARNAVLRAIRLDPSNPEAYMWRGMLRERRGDLRGADRDFRRACRLDPERFPRPVILDDATVETIVEESVRAMHPSIQEYLQQVAILLEEVPDEETLLQWDPPAPPGEILGYFSGYSLVERSVADPWSTLPASIVLFRRNLERIAWDRERMIEELRITVLHEVGHFLGLDEDDLVQRGLD
jgi:predicted Zn-dependent protease with MMP-like domain